MPARISIAPLIYEQYKRKDGNYAVKIRVTYDRKSKFITTNLLASPKQLTKDLTPKDKLLKEQIDSVVAKLEAAVNSISLFELKDATVDDVVLKIQHIIEEEDYVFSLDFFEYGQKIADEKPVNSRMNYMCALHSFQEYLNVTSLDITAITSSMMRNYETYLRKKHGNDARAVSLYTAAIAFIHKKAQQQYNNEETGEVYILNPFAYYKCPKQKATKHRAVDAEIIQKLIDIRGSVEGRERLGVDLFLLSFGFMGMNCPDLYYCNVPKNGIVVYERIKTRDRRDDNAEMHIRIEHQIEVLCEEYKDATGKKAFNFYHRYSTYRNLSRAANIGLDEVSKRLVLEESLTMYVARHAWASIAYSIGIDKSIINDCLVHVDRDMRTTDIYIKKDWSVLWEANRKVLQTLKWD